MVPENASFTGSGCGDTAAAAKLTPEDITCVATGLGVAVGSGFEVAGGAVDGVLGIVDPPPPPPPHEATASARIGNATTTTGHLIAGSPPTTEQDRQRRATVPP